MSNLERFSHFAASIEPDAPESRPTETPTTRVVASRNSYTVTHDGTAGGSVASTLRRDGTGHSVETEPGNANSRTSVQVAERLGLLRMSEGRWADVQSEERQQAQQALYGTQPEAQQADPGAEVFTPNSDAELAAVIEPLSQSSFDTTLARGAALAIHGQGDLASIGATLARENGMDPGQGAAVARVMLNHYEGAALRALELVGVVGKERQAQFLAEARQSHRGELAAAVQQLTHGRDPAGFKALGQAFADRNPGPEVGALREAGFEVTRSGTGGWLARKGSGGWQPVAQILAGLKG